MAVIVAVAVDTDGRRTVRGITVMPSETAACFADVPRSLTRRGRSWPTAWCSRVVPGSFSGIGRWLGSRSWRLEVTLGSAPVWAMLWSGM